MTRLTTPLPLNSRISYLLECGAQLDAYDNRRCSYSPAEYRAVSQAAFAAIEELGADSVLVVHAASQHRSLCSLLNNILAARDLAQNPELFPELQSILAKARAR